MRLSILVCGVPKRLGTGPWQGSLTKVVRHLCSLASYYEDVEVLCLIDNKKRTVGDKRNALLAIAKGEYVVFVDDDDMVDWNYVDEIYGALRTNPDVVTFVAEAQINDAPAKMVFYNYHRNEDRADSYMRMPDQKCVIRRTLALQIGFKDVNCGEDYDFASRLQPFIKSYVHIDKRIYYYLYRDNITEAQKKV